MSSEDNEFLDSNANGSIIKEEKDTEQDETSRSYLESEAEPVQQEPQTIDEIKQKFSAVMSNFKKKKDSLLM